MAVRNVQQPRPAPVSYTHLTLDVVALLEDTRAAIERVRTPDFAASRGEYLNGVLLANYLGWEFIDAADVVRFDKQGVFAAEWTNRVRCV